MKASSPTVLNTLISLVINAYNNTLKHDNTFSILSSTMSPTSPFTRRNSGYEMDILPFQLPPPQKQIRVSLLVFLTPACSLHLFSGKRWANNGGLEP